VQLKNKQVIII